MIVVNDNTITTCPRLGFGNDSHTDFFSSTLTSGSFFTGLDPYNAASGSLNGFLAALLPPNGDLVAAAPGAGAKGERASAAPNGLSGFFTAGVGVAPAAVAAPNGLAGFPASGAPAAVAAPNGLAAGFPAGVGRLSNGDVAPVVASNGDFFFTDPVSPNVDGNGFGFHFFAAAAASSSSSSFVVSPSPALRASRCRCPRKDDACCLRCVRRRRTATVDDDDGEEEHDADIIIIVRFSRTVAH